ncbi:hypothetical protein COV81_02585, partial [Candidatus Peregrinibacteria bacterium CG11_big_fil_rev_8_21_14_0_20_41_10]
ETGLLPLIERLCPYIRADFAHAGHYLNRENLDLLATNNQDWATIRAEIDNIQSVLGIQIGPEQPHHILHRNFTSNIYQRLQLDEDFAEDVLKAAEIRKSLG